MILMKQGRKLLCLVFALFVLAGVCWLAMSGRSPAPVGPKYRGKTAQEWFDLMVRERNGYAASQRVSQIEALRELGTNSIPIVVRAFNKENGQSGNFLFSVWQHLPQMLQNKIPRPPPNSDIVETAREVAGGLKEEHRREVASAVVPHLARVFDTARGPDRAYILNAFIRDLDPDAELIAPVLVKAISDADLEVRKAAAFMLMEYGWKTEYGGNKQGPLVADAVAPLMKALRSNDPELRSQALDALGWLGPTARAAVPAVEEFLNDPKLRISAAYALWRMDRRTNVAVEVIPDDINSPSGNAPHLLGQIGSAARPAIPALTSALANKENNVRFNSCRALWRIDRGQVQKILPVLIQILQSKATHSFHLAETLKLLTEIGPEAKAAIPAVRSLENHSDEGIRNRCREALEAIGQR